MGTLSDKRPDQWEGSFSTWSLALDDVVSEGLPECWDSLISYGAVDWHAV